MNNMRYFIVEDDLAIRRMIAEIIEDQDLGMVVGEAEDGSQIDATLLQMKQVDILLIDQMMPIMDGLETVKAIEGSFQGKVVMISQVTSKDMIGEAYNSGVEYYITKPVNKLELVGVLKRVSKQVLLQRSISDIHRTLSGLNFGTAQGENNGKSLPKMDIAAAGKHHLSELGILGTTGSKDLLDLLVFLENMNEKSPFGNEFPSLKVVFVGIAEKRLGSSANENDLKKEVKAAEQRVRRAICQALSHLASLGLTDYTHPTFETYASTFFNFSEVRQRMLELEQYGKDAVFQSSINTKKFVKVLYLESVERKLHLK